jgi:hypothetical protein
VPGDGYTLGLEVVTVVSSAGGKKGFVYKSRHRAYKALRRKGKSKSSAARIANAGRTHGARSRMARKAARTRRARGE